MSLRAQVLKEMAVQMDRKPDWAYAGSREARDRDRLNERREYFRRFGL